VEHRFTVAAPSNRAAQWRTFVREGVVHIWMGYDHILFLLALLLPAVLRRDGARWREVEGFRPAFYQVLKVVTAFTLAHSITLSLAALEIVRLPTRLVESVIAGSVALVAANNLRPMFGDKSWLVAFGFGLVHGFGFANVLGEIELPPGALALGLVGFNVGVELGQLAIVGAFLPLAFAARRSWLYQSVTFKLGSAGIVLVAMGWLTERALDWKLMPF
jgi:xanthosine utilization system XapX-like protein